ncbi:MAG TPA: ArgP/LysG family DNA-binding transcriptional regulator, partial [Acidovorax temperans]|nr:ArgP/LysG family DNA-binding transcriptional regulator [Acidovorax temperans]
LTPPVHWLPEAHAFVKATEAGLGWGMAPDLMVAGHLRAGTLVELMAGKPVDVPLYWQYWRLNVQALARMTAAVQSQAHRALATR